MRPDPHKKKKSNQYKKKHETATNKNLKDQNKKDLDKPKKHLSRPEPIEKPDVTNVVVSHSGPTKHEERESSFTKREITSNWERYNQEENVETVIGADFDTLMNASGGIDAYYHPDTIDDTSFNPPMFEIDVLAETLHSFSFAEKYKLDQLDIDEEILSALRDNAVVKANPMKISTINPFAQALGFDFGNTKAADAKELLINELKLPPATINNNENGKENARDTNDVLLPETCENKESTNFTTDGPNMENDLDDILNITDKYNAESVATSFNASVTPPKEIETFAEDENLEEWLDSIL